jgi:hypothetical protein
MYALDGHVCAQLINPDRPAWKEAGHPTDAEKISALDEFFAYCGKYEVNEAKHVMMHLPDVASWPGLVGSKQPRPYTFSDSGDLLTFSGKELDEPGAESYSITWRKMGATPKPSPVADGGRLERAAVVYFGDHGCSRVERASVIEPRGGRDESETQNEKQKRR